jgi:chemotaxis protein MotB
LFSKGKSTIQPGGLGDKAVQALALSLSKVLRCFSLGPASDANATCNPDAAFIDAVFVEGHTDNQPITGVVEGGITDNLALSARRAIITMQAVYSDQPSLSQMYSISPSEYGKELGQGYSPLVNASAFGETRPAYSNDTDEGKRNNRRIDVRVLMYSPRSENLEMLQKLLRH